MEGTDLNWRKSSYSGNGGGECVEVGASPGAVVVRDTIDRTGPVLWFTPAAWRRFAGQVKRALASGLRPRSTHACSGVSRFWELPLRRPEVPRFQFGQYLSTPRVRRTTVASPTSPWPRWPAGPARGEACCPSTARRRRRPGCPAGGQQHAERSEGGRRTPTSHGKKA
jgi:uncharacterized protein DUF397